MLTDNGLLATLRIQPAVKAQLGRNGDFFGLILYNPGEEAIGGNRTIPSLEISAGQERATAQNFDLDRFFSIYNGHILSRRGATG